MSLSWVDTFFIRYIYIYALFTFKSYIYQIVVNSYLNMPDKILRLEISFKKIKTQMNLSDFNSILIKTVFNSKDSLI